MLEYIKSNKLEHICDVRSKYPYCRVLLKDFDTANMSGIVYAVSSSTESFKQLCAEQDALIYNGVPAMIVGSYAADAVGELCENDWISVTEQLPEPKQIVHIRYRRKNDKEEIAEAWYDGGYIFNLCGSLRFQRINSVTQWKPKNLV